MIYKGKEIDDKQYVSVNEDPIRVYDSNYVELDSEDLMALAEEYKKKEAELKNSGIDFKDLKLVFWAKDYDYNPNGHDTDEEAQIYFSYLRLETEKESEERILRKMSYIDQQIKDEEREKEATALSEKVEIERAMKLLEKNGYKINK